MKFYWHSNLEAHMLNIADESWHIYSGTNFANDFPCIYLDHNGTQYVVAEADEFFLERPRLADNYFVVVDFYQDVVKCIFNHIKSGEVFVDLSAIKAKITPHYWKKWQQEDQCH